MFKLSHKMLIAISGFVWLAVGSFLLYLGLNFLVGGVDRNTSEGVSYPVIDFLNGYVNGVDQVVLVLVAISLFIGYLKGRYVLGKSAERGVERIRSFPNPTGLQNIYSLKYYILLGVMVGFGLSIKFLGLSNDVRGIVDVIIGSALINGGMIYFRLAGEQKRTFET